MEPIRPLTALGLMSGTSLDGVDAALLVTDGVDIFEKGAGLCRPYDMDMRAELKSVMGDQAQPDGERVKEVERKMTLFHAQVVEELLDSAGIDAHDVDIIGFHGQTIYNRPDEHVIVQIGDGDLLAKQTGIPVVNRFHTADMQNGGQGGPLLTSYHAALTAKVEKPVAVLNIGGVANVTWIGENGEMTAFDTGPGNVLIDEWCMRKCGMNFDFDGNLAASGAADEKIVSALMRKSYFKKKPPKSADRSDFDWALEHLGGASAADGAATLTAFSAAAAVQSAQFFPSAPKKWILCGGGANNPTLVRLIKQGLKANVCVASEMKWDVDLLEAQGIAFLAVRCLFGLPLSFPATTGVPHSMCGGMLHKVPEIALKKTGKS